MMEELHLLVGTSFELGPPPRTLALTAELLARTRGGPPLAQQMEGGGALLVQTRALYRTVGERPFLVHVVERYGDDPPRAVGRVEHYRSWAELAEVHPDLAARVAANRRALPTPPAHLLPTSVGEPAPA